MVVALLEIKIYLKESSHGHSVGQYQNIMCEYYIITPSVRNHARTSINPFSLGRSTVLQRRRRPPPPPPALPAPGRTKGPRCSAPAAGCCKGAPGPTCEAHSSNEKRDRLAGETFDYRGNRACLSMKLTMMSLAAGPSTRAWMSCQGSLEKKRENLSKEGAFKQSRPCMFFLIKTGFSHPRSENVSQLRFIGPY